MPAPADGMWAAIGAATVAALTQLGRVLRPRRTRRDLAAEERAHLDAEWARLDEEKRRLLAEIRDELDECRRRSEELEALIRAERLRTGILIRAMQEAGITVPDIALLAVTFDAATGTYQLRDEAA